MPILEADKGRTVMVIKRSLRPGFAGVENELFYLENTMMVFGDAKAVAGLGGRAPEARHRGLKLGGPCRGLRWRRCHTLDRADAFRQTRVGEGANQGIARSPAIYRGFQLAFGPRGRFS